MALLYYYNSPITCQDKTTFIHDCIFFSNNVTGLILVNTPSDTVLEDCMFTENLGTPIVVYQSEIAFKTTLQTEEVEQHYLVQH